MLEENYIVYGIDLKAYTQSFDKDHLPTVINFLELFGWDDEVKIVLRKLAKLYRAGQRVKSHIVRDRRVGRFELPRLRTIVGSCPKCGKPLYGEPMPSCEQQSTNRIFLKLCYSCPYYSETFLKRGKYIEIEGD